jgi:quercetin dioxygenase-like cupin family protein
MNITRIAQAPDYHPPNHFGMRCQRLQGKEAGPAEQVWLGLSTIEPGGHTGSDASACEKHYVVLSGELTVTSQGTQTEMLQPLDSCRIAPGEQRELRNLGSEPVRVLLAMAMFPPADRGTTQVIA